MSDRFERHARTVTLLTLVSRMTGLARDAALSRIFGVTAIMDAFWFAFMIPNLFRRLFGEGALSAAFLPVYSQLNRDDPHTARQLASLTVGSLIALLGGITLIGEIILYILSLQQDHDHLALRLMMIMLPYMPLVCLVAIFGAMLQVHRRFGPTAAAPIVLNLFIVVAAIGFASRSALTPGNDDAAHQRQVMHISAVAASVLLAGIVQVIWSTLSLKRAGALPPATVGARTPRLKDSFKQMLTQVWPMLIGLSVLQLNTFVDGLIASYPTTIGATIFGIDYPLDKGSLTAVSNAQRLYEFPLGVFGIAVATAIFPALAKVANDGESFSNILRRGLRLVIYIGLPASVGLMMVRLPLTAAILQGKNFTAQDTQRVAAVLLGYAPAIWAYSMTHTLTRAFYAKGDSLTPVRVAMGIVVLNLVLNITLIWTPLKEAGLAWSTATCAIVQVMILLRLTRKHVQHAIDETVFRSWMKTIFITAIMAAAVLAVDAAIAPSPALAGTWRWSLIELGILVSVGAIVMAALSLAMRMQEFAWALGRRGQQ
jgi:putative peptidoglycan lipid II flippase